MDEGSVPSRRLSLRSSTLTLRSLRMKSSSMRPANDVRDTCTTRTVDASTRFDVVKFSVPSIPKNYAVASPLPSEMLSFFFFFFFFFSFFLFSLFVDRGHAPEYVNSMRYKWLVRHIDICLFRWLERTARPRLCCCHCLCLCDLAFVRQCHQMLITSRVKVRVLRLSFFQVRVFKDNH
jgi:hypothetical protein